MKGTLNLLNGSHAAQEAGRQHGQQRSGVRWSRWPWYQEDNAHPTYPDTGRALAPTYQISNLAVCR